MIDLNDIRKLLITLLAISLIALCLSCGTRKTQKSNVKEEVKTEQTAKVNTDIETKKETQTVINDESSELEITPIDTAKVLIINGKTYKNAKVKIVNRKSNTTINAKEIVKDKTQTQTKAKLATKTQTSVKDTEKKSNPFLPLLWLLVPLGLYFILRYYKKSIGLWI